MFSSLDRADMVVTHTRGRRCFQTDHRSVAEIQQEEEVSILFALTRVLGPMAKGAADEVVYLCAEPPPEFLQRAVAAAGGKLQVKEGPVLVYEGLLGQPEEFADDAFRRLAHRVLRERNASLDESALEALERELMPAPDKETNELVYWTLVTWRDPRAAMPWLTYGEDLPNLFGHFSKDNLQAQALDALHTQALESLKTVSLEELELDQGGLKMLAFFGPFYAAEKVLDIDFMRGLHERIGSPSLVAGIPRRGLLYVMDARVKPTLLRVFCGMCEMQYTREESEPISMTPLLIEDGQITGFIWVRPQGDAKLVRAAELTTASPRGFFSWLFGWKRG